MFSSFINVKLKYNCIEKEKHCVRRFVFYTKKKTVTTILLTLLLTCFLDFLTIGCGLSSSSENVLVLGSNSRPEDAIDIAEIIIYLYVPVLKKKKKMFLDSDWQHWVLLILIINLLESAGEQGLRVAGLSGSQGEGDGDLSLLVSVSCIGGSWPMISGPWGGSRGPPLAGMPSPVVMPFSDRNSSRSTYWRECCFSIKHFFSFFFLLFFYDRENNNIYLLLWNLYRMVMFCPKDLVREKRLELQCYTKVLHRLFFLHLRVPLWIFLQKINLTFDFV